ncbi:hypothetical protein H0H92_009035 [Tricholoma furcatifolium]|nr:hypothetical protein H0H92_009035 [Tricholoma furcatifolium]
MLWGIFSFLLLSAHVNAQHFRADVGDARADEPFWLETIKHQGSSPYNPDPDYQVFRNVKDFGAVGDGITDDTFAINVPSVSDTKLDYPLAKRYRTVIVVEATTRPATLRQSHLPWFTFPQGKLESSHLTTQLTHGLYCRKYRVSAPITLYYYTQFVGDATSLPVLLASEDFEGIAVIDANPYKAGGSQWFDNTENNFRSVRNFVIDVRSVPPERSQGTGIHWQVARATSLMNIVFEMSSAPGTAHQGVWMENGSGGIMSDLVFNGGKFGMWVGNQQFTVRNVTINNADTAILQHWGWAWTFQGVTINNCRACYCIGFDFLSGVSAVSLVDTVVRNTVIAVRSSAASNLQPKGSLIIDNMHLENVKIAIADSDDRIIVGGGAYTDIKAWGQGNMYSGYNSTGNFNQGFIDIATKPSALLDSTGRVFGKSQPQYAGYSVRQFLSAKDYGARGDGITDDTGALLSVMNEAILQDKIVFLDAGTYIVTRSFIIPAGSRIVGEAWPVIAGRGIMFSDQNSPRPVVRVGTYRRIGAIEITDVIFSTVGPSPGAIVVEWNIMQDSENQGNADWVEGTWIWSATRDLDGPGNSPVSIYSGRGVLSEARGPPYWQPVPAAPQPFVTSRAYKDPSFTSEDSSAWGLTVKSSKNIFTYGGVFSSFFNNRSQTCLETRNCQAKIADFSSDSSDVSIYSLSTIGSNYQISVDDVGFIRESDNANGFVSTLSSWVTGSKASDPYFTDGNFGSGGTQVRIPG